MFREVLTLKMSTVIQIGSPRHPDIKLPSGRGGLGEDEASSQPKPVTFQ